MRTTAKENDNVITIDHSPATIICASCGKVLPGQLEIDTHSCCFNSEKPMGWTCPRCGSGVNPNKNVCPCNEPEFRLS